MTGCTEVITHKDELYGSSYTIFAQYKRHFFSKSNNIVLNDK